MATAFSMVPIVSLDDSRVASYRNMRERNLRAEGLFIAEGALLVERLLQSRFAVESLFVTEENAARVAKLLDHSPHKKATLYAAKAALMREIVGFDFHRGALAIGKRTPFSDVESLVSKALNKSSERVSSERCCFLACPATETGENLGLILRSAAAFEVDAVLLSNEGADPLSRRCLRQSMGAALTLPLATSQDLLADLSALRQAHDLKMVAAVADKGAVPLGDFTFPQRAVLIVGHEFRGLNDEWLAACDYRVIIPLAPGCDSLNVAVATGIFLHQMRSEP